MILIATGVNELIAPLVLPFIPLYVYLAAVALVVLFDGPLAGAVAAILAVEAYSLLYTPRILFAFGAAAATVTIAALLRGLLRVRLRSEERPRIFTASPPLIETSIVASDTEAELLAEIEDLRAELRNARENATAPPAQSEDDRAWEIAEALRARDEEVAALRQELDEAYSAHAADRLTLAVELDRARTSLEHERALAGKRAVVQLALDEAHEEIALLRARIADLEPASRDVDSARSEMTALQHSLDLERARAEGEKTLREHAEAETAAVRAKLEGMENAFNERLQTIVAHLASDHEIDVGQAMVEKEEARAEARALQMRIEALQKKVDEIEKVKPPRILVAHPDEDLRRNAQASLERAGYHVVTAADGLEALKLAASEQPDVVIADAVMPKMNGRELCQLLKSHERTAHIRVLLLLRAIDETPKGDLVPDDVLRKPVPFEKLRSTLATLLGKGAA